MLDLFLGGFFNIVITIIVFVLLLGIIVFIHELGHFLAAKKAGVVVQEFAFGFGPKLWGKYWKGTEYKINLYPVGGYCKMLGDQDGSSFLRYNPKEYAKEDKEFTLDYFKKNKLDPKTSAYEEIEQFVLSQQKSLKEEEYQKIQNYMVSDYIPHHPGNFDNVSRLKRVVIVSAGVVMNFILGVVIYYIFFLINGFYVDVPKIGNPVFIGAEVSNLPYLEAFYNTDNAYANSIIIEADGNLITSKEGFLQILREKYNKPITLKLQKITEAGYEQKTANIVLNGDGYASKFDLDLYQMPIVSNVNKDSLAESQGLKSGDILLSLNGQSLEGKETLSKTLPQLQNQSVVLTLLTAEGQKKELSFLIPKTEAGKSVLGISYYINDPFPNDLLRISYQDNKIFSGFDHAVNMTVYNVTGLVELARQSFAQHDLNPVVSNVTSVVGVSKVVYKLVEIRDFVSILNLTALVSLSLAFMNILPIPLFDGGHLLFIAIEKIRGRKLSDKLQERISIIAFYGLIGLSVLVIFKDILSFDFVQRIIAAVSGIFTK